MMPPFFSTWASDAWSSFASLLARSSVQYASNRYRISLRDLHAQRLQSLEHLLMNLIHPLMFPQAQSSKQQNNVEPIREVGQRQGIGLHAAIRPLLPHALWVRAAIA